MRRVLPAAGEPASPGTGDAGFTMLEVVIAALLIGAMLLTLVASATQGVVYQGLSRQRQTAVGLADKVMEELRALPAQTLARGLYDYTGLSSDPLLASCSAGLCLKSTQPDGRSVGVGAGERVIRCGGACSTSQPPPLGPKNYATCDPSLPSDPLTLDGVCYTWRAYVTQPTDPATGKDLPGQYRLSVWVVWTWRGNENYTRVQSLAAFPIGCKGQAGALVGPACGVGAGDVAGSDIMKVLVTWTPDGTSTEQVYDFSLGNATVGYQSGTPERATGQTTLLDGETVSAVADNDGDTQSIDPNGGTSASMCLDLSGCLATSSWGVIVSQSPPASDGSYVRARFYGAPAPLPSVRAAAAVTDGSYSTCGLPTGADLTAPCVTAKNADLAASQSSVVIEYVVPKDSVNLTTPKSGVFPLVRISAAEILCGSLNNPCTWQNDLNMYTAGGTLSLNLTRQVPRVYLGARDPNCVGRGTDSTVNPPNGDLASPGADNSLKPGATPCNEWLAELSSVCDALIATVATQQQQNPPNPISFNAGCNQSFLSSNGLSTNLTGNSVTYPGSSSSFADTTGRTLTAHYALFSYANGKNLASGDYECLYNDAETGSGPAVKDFLAASGNALFQLPTITWCNQNTFSNTVHYPRLAFQMSGVTFQVATGSAAFLGSSNMVWTGGTTVSFTYAVSQCSGTGKTNVCKVFTDFPTKLTPSTGVKVTVVFPPLDVKPASYDPW